MTEVANVWEAILDEGFFVSELEFKDNKLTIETSPLDKSDNPKMTFSITTNETHDLLNLIGWLMLEKIKRYKLEHS